MCIKNICWTSVCNVVPNLFHIAIYYDEDDARKDVDISIFHFTFIYITSNFHSHSAVVEESLFAALYIFSSRRCPSLILVSRNCNGQNLQVHTFNRYFVHVNNNALNNINSTRNSPKYLNI